LSFFLRHRIQRPAQIFKPLEAGKDGSSGMLHGSQAREKFTGKASPEILRHVPRREMGRIIAESIPIARAKSPGRLDLGN